jgi:hypothetical protein
LGGKLDWKSVQHTGHRQKAHTCTHNTPQRGQTGWTTGEEAEVVDDG